MKERAKKKKKTIAIPTIPINRVPHSRMTLNPPAPPLKNGVSKPKDQNSFASPKPPLLPQNTAAVSVAPLAPVVTSQPPLPVLPIPPAPSAPSSFSALPLGDRLKAELAQEQNNATDILTRLNAKYKKCLKLKQQLHAEHELFEELCSEKEQIDKRVSDIQKALSAIDEEVIVIPKVDDSLPEVEQKTIDLTDLPEVSSFPDENFEDHIPPIEGGLSHSQLQQLPELPELPPIDEQRLDSIAEIKYEGEAQEEEFYDPEAAWDFPPTPSDSSLLPQFIPIQPPPPKLPEDLPLVLPFDSQPISAPTVPGSPERLNGSPFPMLFDLQGNGIPQGSSSDSDQGDDKKKKPKKIKTARSKFFAIMKKQETQEFLANQSEKEKQKASLVNKVLFHRNEDPYVRKIEMDSYDTRESIAPKLELKSSSGSSQEHGSLMQTILDELPPNIGPASNGDLSTFPSSEDLPMVLHKNEISSPDVINRESLSKIRSSEQLSFSSTLPKSQLLDPSFFSGQDCERISSQLLDLKYLEDSISLFYPAYDKTKLGETIAGGKFPFRVHVQSMPQIMVIVEYQTKGSTERIQAPKLFLRPPALESRMEQLLRMQVEQGRSERNEQFYSYFKHVMSLYHVEKIEQIVEDDTFDTLLERAVEIQFFKQGYRIPGKVYPPTATEDGSEKSLEEHNKQCMEIYNQKIAAQRKRGKNFDEKEMQMLTKLKKISYANQNNFETFRGHIDHLSLKLHLCNYRIGINMAHQTMKGDGRIWGDPFHVVNLPAPINKYVTPEEAEVNYIVVHRLMSTERLNRSLTNLMANFISFDTNPLDNSMTLDDFNKHNLQGFIKYTLAWIQAAIINEYNEPLLSLVTFINPFEQGDDEDPCGWMIGEFPEATNKPERYSSLRSLANESVLNAITDVRDSSFLRKGIIAKQDWNTYQKGEDKESLEYWAQKLEFHHSLFFTPFFLEHFDFKGIDDPEVMQNILLFKSLQLGFQFEKMLTGEKIIQEQEWQSNMKFICTVGHKQWYNKNTVPLEKQGPEEGKLMQGWQPCTCYVRYKRCDEQDENSYYILVEYNITHTHPLNYRVVSPKYLEGYLQIGAVHTPQFEEFYPLS